MRMDMKLVSFILMLTVMLLEAKVNLWRDQLFSPKAILNYLFPKDPGIVRVRKSEKIQTNLKNVTILDFIGLVERYGYPAEEHYVTTEDGYNLAIHRISGSPLSKGQEKKKVVFVQHGILCSSDCWVTIGAGKDLPFLLADQGYDVWLGNFRGTAYCRSHIKLSPRNKEFWQFSLHEVGTRDLPAMFDYVLNYTKQKTMRYIGHSMGTTVFLLLLSARPEYNSKIKLGILLAPVAIWKEATPIMEQLFKNIPKIKILLEANDIHEVAALTSTSVTLGRTFCADNKPITQSACAAIIFLLAGSDPPQLNTTALPEIFSNYPAGTNVKTLHHFYQNFVTKKFQAYDYGYYGNYKEYGQITPMKYNLKRVSAPIALFYGANDLIAIETNVLETYRQLPNVILLEKNSYKLFSHLDFLWAIDAKILMYDRVIEIIQENDKQGWTLYTELIYD